MSPSAEPKPDFCKPDSLKEGEDREENKESTNPGEDAETTERIQAAACGGCGCATHTHSQARLIVFLNPRKAGIL